MSAIAKVVLAGAGGAVGPAILQELTKSNRFHVSVLARPGSKTNLPSSVKTLTVDYASVDALTEALKGQDAVVSTLGAFAAADQERLMQAAVAAGVKRFIPSEFGSDTTNPKARALPVYATKVAAQQYLERKAAEGAITYTLMLNGPFLDWGLMVGLLLDVKGRKADLYDGGDVPFSASRTATVGKAIAGVLAHPDQTANRAVRVQDAVVTQRKLWRIAQKVTGTKEEQWTVTETDTAALEAAAYVELSKPSPDANVWAFGFIKRTVWGPGYGSVFSKTDNELLGITEMTDEELEGVVASFAK